ncbi:hypothetical protein GCM10023231_29390 [Olivibacter ginsenosidimutans]|uniref:Tail fiber domain-containing protein n=1 Tax=Olivibacter ginsenosidimutans TaxID=1176537 RepID=A0ABP9BQL2_9SPHI
MNKITKITILWIVAAVCGMQFKGRAQVLGGTKGNYLEINSINGKSTNTFYNKRWLVRDADGTDWLTARLHDGISIDASFLTPMVDSRTWWERDPYNNIQSWGNGNSTYLIIKGGNVGIGTTSPQAKLAVNGNILAKEIKVKTDITVPDYVFEKYYQLPSLVEVEAYVKEHKHLPEIPSAKEIGEEGLDLAKMNLLLLKKVEELTLHLVEERKAWITMERELTSLKKAVYH